MVGKLVFYDKDLDQEPEPKPFHESIIPAISRCQVNNTGELLRLLSLIRETIITEGHDEIGRAIDRCCHHWPHRYSKWVRKVKGHLERQKELSIQKKQNG